MAKKHKMNRGVKAVGHQKKDERKWPDCIHSFDAHGNVFATFACVSGSDRPRYYAIDELDAIASKGGDAPEFDFSITTEVIAALPEIRAEMTRLAKS